MFTLHNSSTDRPAWARRVGAAKSRGLMKHLIMRRMKRIIIAI